MIRVLFALLAVMFSPASSAPDEPTVLQSVEIQIPLRFATLGTPTPEVGVAIVVSNVAEADKQISTILLKGLQDLGLQIESPKLDLKSFLLPGKEWTSSAFELNDDWIKGYNAAAPSPLPAGRVYAVKFVGRYEYAPANLRIALAVELLERSQLGPFRNVRFAYSGRYFADRLERSIRSELVKQPTARS